MNQPPAFQFYPDDFLSGTVDMTNEEVGAYIRLLCHSWAKDGLPNDPERLSRMAGAMPVPSLGYVLGKFQAMPDGKLRNRRLEEVRAEQTRRRQVQSEKGAAGAKKRWENGTGNSTGNACAIPQAMPKAWPEDSSPSPSPSTIINTIAVAGVGGVLVKEVKRPVTADPQPTVVPPPAAVDRSPRPAEAQKVPRARNVAFDALATASGLDPLVLTAGEGGKIGKALRGITQAFVLLKPGGTPGELAAEIARRAANYRTNMPGIALTPTGLESNWGRCNVANPPRPLVPAWVEKKSIEEKISRHPANPESKFFVGDRVTPDQKLELRGLRQRERELV